MCAHSSGGRSGTDAAAAPRLFFHLACHCSILRLLLLPPPALNPPLHVGFFAGALLPQGERHVPPVLLQLQRLLAGVAVRQRAGSRLGSPLHPLRRLRLRPLRLLLSLRPGQVMSPVSLLVAALLRALVLERGDVSVVLPPRLPRSVLRLVLLLPPALNSPLHVGFFAGALLPQGERHVPFVLLQLQRLLAGVAVRQRAGSRLGSPLHPLRRLRLRPLRLLLPLRPGLLLLLLLLLLLPAASQSQHPWLCAAAPAAAKAWSFWCNVTVVG